MWSMKMRLKLLRIVGILLIAGSIEARPQKVEIPILHPEVSNYATERWRPVPGLVRPGSDDVPQIIDSTSRYKEPKRSSKKSIDRYYHGTNNRFAGVRYSNNVSIGFGMLETEDLKQSKLKDINSRRKKGITNDPFNDTVDSTSIFHGRRERLKNVNYAEEVFHAEERKFAISTKENIDNNIKITVGEIFNNVRSNRFQSKTATKNKVRLKSNFSQQVPYLQLKNWPNAGVQNIQDLFNYDMYTSFDVDNSKPETDDNFTNDSMIYENVPVIQEPNMMMGEYSRPKPPILVFENSLPPNSPTRNNIPGAVTIYDTESLANSKPGVEEIMQWLQIPAFAANESHVDRPLTNDFEPILEYLEPNQPLQTIPNINKNEQLGTHADIHEIISESNEDLQNHEQEEVVADAGASVFSGEPTPGSTATVIGNVPIHEPDLAGRLKYNSTSVISQNTVVHILNIEKKQPNVTMGVTTEPSAHKIASFEQAISQKNSIGSTELLARPSATSNNIHIMFTSIKDKENENLVQNISQKTGTKVPEAVYNEKINCPIITINSFTRVNNSIQSKEGCIDLNIIINSHISHTNVFKPAQTNGNLHINEDQNFASNGANNEYSTIAENTPNYGTSVESYENFSIGSGQITPQNDYLEYLDTNKVQNSTGSAQNYESVSQNPSVSTFEVFQGTQINVQLLQGSLEGDIPTNLSELMNTEIQITPPSPVEDVSGLSNEPIESVPLNGNQITQIPNNGGIPPLADFGSATAPSQADTPISSGTPSLQNIANHFSELPNQLANLPNQPNQPNIGNALSGGLLANATTGNGAQTLTPEDDEQFDLTPLGLLESMTSLFTYFTFLNPLNYGFFSFALTPFAVLAAGVFGVAAALFPWAFPGVLDFGRAADKITIIFRPNLEEVVEHSIHKYKHWNEWKSKRKRRRK